MTELTIIIPSIHPERWNNVSDSILKSCGSIDYEIIFVGPVGFTAWPVRCNFLQDYGTPTVAFQKAALQANGKYITIAADDSLARPGAIEACFNHFKKNYKPTDLMICTYIEGVNLPDYPHPRTAMFGEFYWQSLHQFQTHRQRGLLQGLDNWYWGQFLINTDYFIEVGGLDCAYIHMNFSLHDLCYRVQREGAKVYLSNHIWNTDFIERPKEHPVLVAETKDRQVFEDHYSTKEVVASRLTRLPYDSWTRFPDHETYTK